MIFTRDALIGFAVLIAVIAGIVWYDFSHAPAANAPGTTASTTPTGSATEPVHITESAEFYTVDTQYPGQTLLAKLPGNADLVAQTIMKQWEVDMIDQFKQNFTALDASYAQHLRDSHLQGSLTIQYETHQSARTVSYAYTMFSDTLGAHPNTTYKTFTFDTTSGQELALGDLFSPGTDYLGWLSTYSRAQLPAMIATREELAVSDIDMDMLDAGTTADSSNFADFYLDGSNLVVLFPPYAVGPYVLGSMELDIPLSKIPGLKPEYQP